MSRTSAETSFDGKDRLAEAAGSSAGVMTAGLVERRFRRTGSSSRVWPASRRARVRVWSVFG
jgi:hypothetical protein